MATDRRRGGADNTHESAKDKCVTEKKNECTHTHTRTRIKCIHFFLDCIYYHHYGGRRLHFGSPRLRGDRFSFRRRVVDEALCARIIVGRQVGAVYNHTPPMIYNIIILCTTVYATGLIKRKFSINLLPHPRVSTLYTRRLYNQFTGRNNKNYYYKNLRASAVSAACTPPRIGHRYPMRFCLFFNNHASVAVGYTYHTRT